MKLRNTFGFSESLIEAAKKVAEKEVKQAEKEKKAGEKPHLGEAESKIACGKCSDCKNGQLCKKPLKLIHNVKEENLNEKITDNARPGPPGPGGIPMADHDRNWANYHLSNLGFSLNKVGQKTLGNFTGDTYHHSTGGTVKITSQGNALNKWTHHDHEGNLVGHGTDIGSMENHFNVNRPARPMGEAIENPNSSGQGHDPDHVKNAFHDTITKAGYKYSHSTPVTYPHGEKAIHHTYAYPNTEHKVSVSVHGDINGVSSQSWHSTTSPASGRQMTGMNDVRLAQHLKGKARRYKLGEETLEEGSVEITRIFPKALWKCANCSNEGTHTISTKSTYIPKGKRKEKTEYREYPLCDNCVKPHLEAHPDKLVKLGESEGDSKKKV